jgi:hypothetical protein
MFNEALLAKIPIVGVFTDDPVNFADCLVALTGRSVRPWPDTGKFKPVLGSALYWTDRPEVVTVENYRLLMDNHQQLVVVNPEKRSNLVFDAGVFPTPEKPVREYLKPFVKEQDLPPLLLALKGLSLKTAQEVVQLTMVRTNSVLPAEVRRTRTLVSGAIQGLQPLDTDLDFYIPPAQLTQWFDLNDAYFLNPKTPLRLVPRGLLFSGSPGVGKSMAARAIAQHYKIPLFRLDVGAALNKYIGESESRISRSLSMIERESPCVMLVDEVEKIFTQQQEDDSGVTLRILGQLLWWLSDHRSRVLTVMTTNNLERIPLELYRPGRVDKVVDIQKLNMKGAKEFAFEVYRNIMPTPLAAPRKQKLEAALTAKVKAPIDNQYFSHSEVADMVYEQIKINHWYPLNTLEESVT